jgi:hypothetical protein
MKLKVCNFGDMKRQILMSLSELIGWEHPFNQKVMDFWARINHDDDKKIMGTSSNWISYSIWKEVRSWSRHHIQRI